jgi:ppGpp synthetase/RelA/SpoT-type nucleotidyltranferase
MKISKAEIDRLGNKVREEKDNLNEATLNQLQTYRTSHREVLSQIFTILCSYTKKIHPTSIVTYRIKRFESIIGKLNRYPDMRFSRMWDIGGCRCIMRHNIDVYKLKEYLLKDASIEIVKEYDYIEVPQKDGYKSLHLFIKCKNDEKIIEVQLRSLIDHNWATLVEITDVLYDSKLKELGDNQELGRFHYLLSKINTLQISEKKEIAEILQKYNYLEKLSAVFSRNYIKVRRQWFEIESQKGYKYFLIETTKEEVPKIESFFSAQESEERYFSIYKTTQNANIILTHLPTPSYNQISIAYSNYILTFHSFLDEYFEILESLIVESIEKKKYYEYFNQYCLYNILVYRYIRNFLDELKEIQNYNVDTKINNQKKDTRKEKEWRNDMVKQLNKLNERSVKLGNKYKKSMPNGWLDKFIIENITKYVAKKYKRKIQKILPITALKN